MGMGISRNHACYSLTDLSLTTALATTPEIKMAEFVGGNIAIPTGSSITLLTFYGAPKQSDDSKVTVASPQTFLPMYTQANAAITMTVAAGRCYPLPAEAFGVQAIKIVTDAAGTAEVSLKG